MKRFSSLHRVGPLTALLLVGIASTLHAQIRYFITDLGTLGGTMGTGNAVNSRGQVAGVSSTSGNQGFAFRTAPNRPINPATDDLGTLGGVAPAGDDSVGNSINFLGQVVGSAAITDGNPHAFRTSPNRAINPATDDLGTLDGTYSVAYGINDWGQVVGEAAIADGSVHAFRTAPNRPINLATDDLGTLGGVFNDAAAQGINDWGQVVGYSSARADAGAPHAFRTAPNRPINPATDDLGTLGGTQSIGYAINNSGQATGGAFLSGDQATHAFRTAPNRPINPVTDDLGTLGGVNSYGLGINDWGQVVGYSQWSNSAQNSHAFLFTGGQMYDLNNLIPADFGWELQQASGINDVGQITGFSTHSGVTRPFLLTPAREGLCKNSGWENFGFTNEEQCIQFAETGK